MGKKTISQLEREYADAQPACQATRKAVDSCKCRASVCEHVRAYEVAVNVSHAAAMALIAARKSQAKT